MNSGNFSSKIIHPDQLNRDEIDLWNRYLKDNNNGTTNIAFLSYAFAFNVHNVKPHVYVCIIYKNSDPIIFFPFQFKNPIMKKLGIAERLGEEMSDYTGIVAKQGCDITAQQLMKYSKLNYYSFSHLDEKQVELGLSGEKPEKGLLIDLGLSSETYWTQLAANNKKMVQDTNRREKKLIQEYGELSFMFDIPDQSRLEKINKIIDHKRKQYTRTKVTDALKDKWKRQLLNMLDQNSDPYFCQPVVSELYAGKALVASHYGIRCDNRLHYWFPVYNRSLSKYSPGRLLMKHVILSSTHNGIQVIDRGVGVTQAKKDFANKEHLYFRGAWYKKNLISISFRAFMSVGWRFSGLVTLLKKSKKNISG